MKKFNYISSAKRTLKIESDSIRAIANQLDSSFTKLCDAVMNTKGKFVIMGVGKSGHIAQKVSATLSSLYGRLLLQSMYKTWRRRSQFT